MAKRHTICNTVLMAVLMAIIGVVDGHAQVPCFFIFGDSLSDSGNNNDLLTIAKANFYPYGIDFPGGATGRFTNGRTTVDLIGDLLGLDDYIPSFPRSGGEEALKGVNYASGSAGIRPATGSIVGYRISMDQQVSNHQTTVSRMTELVGSNNATIHLKECLYSVNVASNDWMLDFFDPLTPLTRVKYTTETYAEALLQQLSQQLTSLYKLGARKVVLFGVGPLGCLPPLNTVTNCVQLVNKVLQAYNDKLRLLVDDFNNKYSDSKFIFINTIGIVGDDLSGLGLRVTNVPCCGEFTIACTPLSSVCKDRDAYAYWDNEHPTEAANKVLAGRAYKAQHPNDTYPMDISHLADLQL